MKNSLNKFFNVFSTLITGRNVYYNYVISKNWLRKTIKGKAENKFLFILAPPYSGSTLLNEFISSSKSVSVNNQLGTREGQKLPLVRKLMYENCNRWDEFLELDWKFIKSEWLKHWNLTLPILLEKSPPSLVRAQSLVEHFTPAYFIIFYRNPYAHAESLIRRNSISAIESAHLVINFLKYQKKNIENLPNTFILSYEELTEQTYLTLNRLCDFLPELADIEIEREFKAHNFMNKKLGLVNLNPEKIRKLSSTEMDMINCVFNKEKDLLSYYNYDLI